MQSIKDKTTESVALSKVFRITDNLAVSFWYDPRGFWEEVEMKGNTLAKTKVFIPFGMLKRSVTNEDKDALISVQTSMRSFIFLHFAMHIFRAKTHDIDPDPGVDLFANYELLPDKIQRIIESFDEGGDLYAECKRLEEKLEPHGYTFDWGLDGVPYDLRKIRK